MDLKKTKVCNKVFNLFNLFNLNFIQKWFKENSSAVLLILGAILGFAFGIVLKNSLTLTPMAIMYIGLPGKLLIRAIAMILVPLIVCSVSTSNQ